jgi:hypothetical protein
MRNGETPVALVRREDVAGVARALRAQASVLDRLLEAIAGEHRNEPVGRSPERRLLEVVRGLLAGEGADGDSDGGGSGGGGAAVELGAELGYELAGEHVGVIARGVGARELLLGVAGRLDRRLLCVECDEVTCDVVTVWAWLGGRGRIELAALERALAGESSGGGVVFAVGEPARGVAGWRLTHRQAQAALAVAQRRPRRFTRYADVALLAVALKDEVLAGALVEVYLTPLDGPGDRGSVLRETLRAYLAAERSVSSTAAALGVTRRTVENRLLMTEERLGRTLHPCPPELDIALCLDELSDPPADNPQPPPPQFM